MTGQMVKTVLGLVCFGQQMSAATICVRFRFKPRTKLRGSVGGEARQAKMWEWSQEAATEQEEREDNPGRLGGDPGPSPRDKGVGTSEFPVFMTFSWGG